MAKSIKRIFDASAEGRKLVSEKSIKVRDYNDANPVLREQMDKLVAKFDAAPTDYNLVNKHGAHLIDEVVSLYKKVDRMTAETLLDNAKALLPKALELLHEIDGYLGANSEIHRRYRDVYIPEMIEKIKKDDNYRDMKRYRQLEQRREEFIEHATTLEGARALLSVTAMRVESAVEQKELLDIIRGTEFGEDHALPRRKPSASTPKP